MHAFCMAFTVPVSKFELCTRLSALRCTYAECRRQASSMNMKNNGAHLLLIFKGIQVLTLWGENTPEANHPTSNASFPLKLPSWPSDKENTPYIVLREWFLHWVNDSSKRTAFGFIHWVIFGRGLRSHAPWPRMIRRPFKCLEGMHDEAKVHLIIPASAELEKGI